MITDAHVNLLRQILGVDLDGLTNRIRNSDNCRIPWTGKNHGHSYLATFSENDPQDAPRFVLVKNLVAWGLAVETFRQVLKLSGDEYINSKYAATDMGITCVMAHLNLESRNPAARNAPTAAEYKRRTRARYYWSEFVDKTWGVAASYVTWPARST